MSAEALRISADAKSQKIAKQNEGNRIPGGPKIGGGGKRRPT